MSPNTLRARWIAEFGVYAFKARGRQCHVEGNKKNRGVPKPKVWREAPVPCSKCGVLQNLRVAKIVRMQLESFVCDSCDSEERPITCPVCSSRCRSLSHHLAQQVDGAHQKFSQERETSRVIQQWQGKTEDEDFVICRVCGEKQTTLGSHLRIHGLRAEDYVIAYPGAPIRCRRLTSVRSFAAKNRICTGKGDTKTISCPDCQTLHTVSKFLVPGTHDIRCEGCQRLATDALWQGKSEPQDFVTCRACGYRAENLCSHIQNAHSELVGCYTEQHPGALIVALGSSIRDRSHLKGVKQNPESVRRGADALRINLTLEDFKPFLEVDGSVDHRSMCATRGIWHPTLARYMKQYGLKPTRKYLEQRYQARRVILTKEQLTAYRLANGRYSIGQAMAGLGLSFPTVRKEMRRLGLPMAHQCISQALCLKAISVVLGGSTYVEEWNKPEYLNPKTGRRFRFDGFFPEYRLVCEFHGAQHWKFPNQFMKLEHRGLWEALLASDRIKETMILTTPGLHYLVIREDQPFRDLGYIRSRLLELGLPERISPHVRAENGSHIRLQHEVVDPIAMGGDALS